MRGTLGAWPGVARGVLKRAPMPLPEMVLFDARCSFRRAAGAEAETGAWIASAHGGRIAIAGGPSFPVGPTASVNSIDGGRHFLVMSLPSVWRSVAPPSAIPLEQFLEGVLFHELAHAVQARATPSLWWQALKEQGFGPVMLGDDAVQQRFGNIPAFVAAYERERDLFLAAAGAPTRGAARRLACGGLAAMRARRAHYFRGGEARWGRVEEIALTSEGLGNWVAYSWLTKERGLPAALVLGKLHGPDWSQDEGLAMFLVIDRLVPGWQRSMLGKAPVSVEGQLARACGG